VTAPPRLRADHGGAPHPPPRIDLDGVGIDPVTIGEVDDRVAAGLADGRGGVIVTANLFHFHLLHHGHSMGAVFEEATIVVADGTPVVWASRLTGNPLPERVAGSDLIWSLSCVAVRTGRPIGIVGGRSGAAERAAERLTERFPGLVVAGTACPPTGFERSSAAERALIEEIVRWDPGVVFVALGTPKGELFAHLLARSVPDAWVLNVGAAVDMVAGEVTRAPRWAHRSGVEWVFRLAQEPRRLAYRYLGESAPFALGLLLRSIRCRVKRRSRPPGPERRR
jgi:N-acetylglucosaminyldiphosphoundecaprenol N-acetyl-beta-D-mannosaminyltransferase